MSRPAAEVSDYSRRPAPDHLSEGGEQSALCRPVIQCVFELVSVDGGDRVVGRAGGMQIGLTHARDGTLPPRHTNRFPKGLAFLALQSDLEELLGGKVDDDEILRNAVLRQLNVVGEAASCLGDDMWGRLADIPWREIRGFRYAGPASDRHPMRDTAGMPG